MRKTWALLTAAFVVGFAALHVCHVRRAHPVATVSVTADGHHHDARVHRAPATIAAGPSLQAIRHVLAVRAIAPLVEAPIAPVDTLVARGPPRV